MIYKFQYFNAKRKPHPVEVSILNEGGDVRHCVCRHQPSLMEERKGTVTISVPVFKLTNHSKFFWNTHSPLIPCSARIAFRRDLVVFDCQPPSNKRMKLSPTSAILLPWRNTWDTGAFTPSWECATIVLPDCQSLLSLIAAFIWRSIFLMGRFVWTEVNIEGIGGRVNPLWTLT